MKPRPDDFLETLPFRGRVLVRRLESFGDIVVGFSISQLAIQLGVPHHPADLVSNPLRYALFFITFAVIAIAWLRFHRMINLAFAPGRVDLIAAFGYLAFTALLPYALYANATFSFNADPSGARYGLAAYMICLAGSSVSAFVIGVRSIGRGRGVLSASDLARVRQRTYIEAVLAAAFCAVIVCDIACGPRWSWIFTLGIPAGVRFVRRRINAPDWTAVHIDGVDE